MNFNSIEEIIKYINMGFDNRIVAMELEIPLEIVEQCNNRLQLRRFAKESINENKIDEAIVKLIDFIENNQINLIEKFILAKLRSYEDQAEDYNEELSKISEERKNLGINANFNKILDDIKCNIPKRKSCNISKKDNTQKGNSIDQKSAKKLSEMNCNEETQHIDYSELIKKYKKEIANNSSNIVNKKNLLAFTYYRAGMIEEARNELLNTIDETNSSNAYKLLIILEKESGNLEDAKLWAYDAEDKFPDIIEFKEYLARIAKMEGNYEEERKILRNIISTNTKRGESYQKRYDKIK